MATMNECYAIYKLENFPLADLIPKKEEKYTIIF